jgi:hypothetical protein
MICPATGKPHLFQKISEGVRWCPNCLLEEYDIKGNVVTFPPLIDPARAPVKDRLCARILSFFGKGVKAS